MFNLIKENESIFVETTNIMIYGEPGVGKTSLAFTTNNPILLDFDKGSYRSAYRKDIIKIQNYSDIANNLKQFSKTIENYDTIIIDTIGALQDLIKSYLLVKDVSLNNAKKSFQLYGQLLTNTIDFFNLLQSLGKNIITIAHVQEKTKGEDYVKRPVVIGQTKDKLYQVMDFIGYMSFKNSNRVLTFKAIDDNIECKQTGDIDVLSIPDSMPNDYFGVITEKLVKTINEQNEANNKHVELLKSYIERINNSDLIELNNVIEEKEYKIHKKSLGEYVKSRMLDLNAAFDKETNKIIGIDYENE